jgi:hypothetical protein
MLNNMHERSASSLAVFPLFQSCRSRVSIALAAALLALSGCSSDDTVVAVNFNFAMQVAGVTSLAVTITQAGETPLTATFTPQTTPIDGGTTIKAMYFERITLPASWGDGQAILHVDAKGEGGTVLASNEAVFDVRQNGVVAAYITLPKPVPDAGVPQEDAGL